MSLIRRILTILTAEAFIFLCGCSNISESSCVNSISSDPISSIEPSRTGSESHMTKQISLSIINEIFFLTLEDNETTKELVKRLPLTISFDDYGGFEKVGSLGFSLPRNDTNINTNPGDVVLYNGNNIVIFYGSNSWSYTKIGHIDDVDRLSKALAGDKVDAVFEAI